MELLFPSYVFFFRLERNKSDSDYLIELQRARRENYEERKRLQQKFGLDNQPQTGDPEVNDNGGRAPDEEEGILVTENAKTERRRKKTPSNKAKERLERKRLKEEQEKGDAGEKLISKKFLLCNEIFLLQ